MSADSFESDENLCDIIVVDDVRITPGYVHFKNAYQGKRFKQKVVIQNCGKHLAFIRMLESSSKSFTIMSFPKGIYLSSGMKLTRTVSYTYDKTLGVLKGFVNIWINEKEINYKFFVTLTQTILSIEPQQVDFGNLDAVNRASSRTFYLKNSGCKGSMFAIDLGRNPLGLMVQPMKGVISAKSTVPITVEIVGSKVGDFLEELWLKTDPPLRIVVMGTFIEPKIVLRKWISGLDFTLMHFSSTYYGAGTTRPLFIKNFSSSHSMYCIMAEVRGTTMTLEEARKIDDNYRNFYVRPIDGRVAALKGAIIQLSFTPKAEPRRVQHYAACFLKIIRMDCKDVDTDIYEYSNEIHRDMSDVASYAPSRDTFFKENSTNTIVSFTAEEDTLGGEHEFSFEHSIGVCLYGEAEAAGVILRPTFLALSELTLDKLYQREILVTNKSQILPVKVVYQKVASIDVRPTEFVLARGDCLEILVTIRSTKLDLLVKEITFELLARDVPPEKNVVRKVGVAHLTIRLETSAVVRKPKFDHCVVCTDINDRLDPEFPFRLNEMELAKKRKNDTYYMNYIRSLQRRLPERRSRSIVQKLLRCSNMPYKEPLEDQCRYCKQFIPLPPSLLYNVKITPKSITLRKVAAYTTISDYFEIENLNTFPIQVSTKSSKTCIVFDQLKHVIQSKEKRKIIFEFSTTEVGKYNVNINVLVNDSTLYEVTAVAQVVPKTLKIESETIEFSQRDGHFKFFRLINNLNAYTVFSWDVPDGCYKIFPMLGGIQAERSMLCLVTFDPGLSLPVKTECTLTSESGQQRVLVISSQKREPLVAFDSNNIDLGMIPLNVCVIKKLTLTNLKRFQTVYRIDNCNPIPGIVVEPSDGVLHELNSETFTIRILLKAVIEFSVKLQFIIDEIETIEVGLEGKVAFPSLIFKPSILHFRKMSPCSFDTLAFKVTNSSPCESSVAFPFEEYPEFTVSEDEDDFTHQSQITLPADASKMLFLHFFPVYISTYSILLPYVVNGIIGPTRVNSGRSRNAQYYLEANMPQYENLPSVKLGKLPLWLATVRINCAATDVSLALSQADIGFVFYGKGHYNNMTKTEFVISNVGSKMHTFCIRTDELSDPFSLTPKSDSNIEIYDSSYKIMLEPGEKIVFDAEFSPSEVGGYEVRLPIFLKHYFDNKMFSCLRMTGVYDRPKIISMYERYALEPVPVGLISDQSIFLNLHDHFENCQIFIETDLIGVTVSFDEKPKIGDFLLGSTLHFKTTKPRCINTEIVFRCTCKAECTIAVTGVVENCLLTTHTYAYMLQNRESKVENPSDTSFLNVTPRSKFVNMTANQNTSCFPLFPADDDYSDYACYMRSVRKALEDWLYSQAFYLKSYHRLPDGFADFAKIHKTKTDKKFGHVRPAHVEDLPLVVLLINFAGPRVRKILMTTKTPELGDEMGWFKFTYTTRCNVLKYLRQFPVYLPHVKTKYLLNYEQYQFYVKLKHPETKIMDESTYRRLCTQCFVDLILQIIKVFVFDRVIPLSMPTDAEQEEDDSSLAYDHLYAVMSAEHVGEDILKTGIYGSREKVLIKWLQTCYDVQKETLWNRRPADREVIFFETDLRDGLVLGATIAQYVPYVSEEIRDMYSNPRTCEELHHNACILVRTCQLLRFSYILRPDAFLQSNAIEMLLFVTYLYTILPYYAPKSTRMIEAPLTEKSTIPIQLENLGNDPIVYEVLFFNNPNGLFFALESVVTIAPQTEKAARIRYHAKFVTTATTTVLFSGETPENKYGRSIAMTLLGVADVTEAYQEMPLTLKLYKPCQLSLPIHSPFHVPSSYTAIFGPYTNPADCNKVLYPWQELRTLKRPKELIMHQDTFEFDSEGNTTVSPVVCVQKIGPRDILCYWTNPEVGDWVVKVHLLGKPTEECYERIDVKIPPHYSQLTCKCQVKNVKTGCPKLLYAKLPKINTPLWNARKKMLLYSVEEGAEKQFWSRIVYTSMGTRILKLIFNSETHPVAENIPDSMTYLVDVLSSKLFITVEKVVIDDIISDDFYELPIHPLKSVLRNKIAKLHLVTENGLETRFYNLHFIKGESIHKESLMETNQ